MHSIYMKVKTKKHGRVQREGCTKQTYIAANEFRTDERLADGVSTVLILFSFRFNEIFHLFTILLAKKFQPPLFSIVAQLIAFHQSENSCGSVVVSNFVMSIRGSWSQLNPG